MSQSDHTIQDFVHWLQVGVARAILKNPGLLLMDVRIPKLLILRKRWIKGEQNFYGCLYPNCQYPEHISLLLPSISILLNDVADIEMSDIRR